MKAKLDFAAQLILGAMFVVFGLNGFFHFLPMPPMNDQANAFMGGLAGAGYFFPVLKGVEVLCGLALLARRFVPLALAELSKHLDVEASSNFYWSAPLERPEQGRFLNGVWRARTERSPRDVKFEILRPIEATLGRRRQADKHAARCIDLDLLMYGQRRLQEPDLILPDPEIPLRAFLWHPLRELLPQGQNVPGLAPDHPPSPCRQELQLAPEITEQLRLALHPSNKGTHR